MKYFKQILIGLLFVVITFVSCDMNSEDSDDDIDSIYTINLKDGGKIHFFEDEPGDLMVSAVSKSFEIVASIDDMNCIEIFKKYGSGEVPKVLLDAYARSLTYKPAVEEEADEEIDPELTAELNADNEIFAENNVIEEDGSQVNDVETMIITKGSNHANNYRNPNWDYNTFKCVARAQAGLVVSIQNQNITSKYHQLRLRERKNFSVNLGKETYHTKELYTFVYCTKGSIEHRVKRAKGLFKAGKWKSVGYAKVNQGNWCRIRLKSSVKRYYRTYIRSAEKRRDKYHYMTYYRVSGDPNSSTSNVEPSAHNNYFDDHDFLQ